MGIETKGTDVQTNALISTKNVANEAEQRKIAKGEEYEAAKRQEEIFCALKGQAESKYMSLMAEYKKGYNPSGLQEAQSQYDSIMLSYNDASNNSDILRGSYQSAISYSGKMNLSLTIANSMLA